MDRTKGLPLESRLLPACLACVLAVMALVGCRGPTAPDPTESAIAGASAGDVELVINMFGVGNAFRPGDVTGIRVECMLKPESDLEDATSVWIQWDVPNPSGDIAGYGRSVTLTKGVPLNVWLYAPVPPDATPQSIWSVRVFAESNGNRGREISSLRISPAAANAQFVEIDKAMIGIVGPQNMQLSDYTAPMAGGQLNRPLASHEDTRTVFGIRPTELPDRWEALQGFEALAWGDATPQDMSEVTSRAVREYIRRGGHLVISLPSDANPWSLGNEVNATYLYDLLPGAPRKDDDVMLSDLLPLISRSRALGENMRDFTVSLRVFADLTGDFSAIEDSPYEPMLTLPDGRVIGVQRPYGHGRISIVGLDLSSQRLYSVPLASGANGVPQADVFWNRILGRRTDTPSGTELDAIAKADRLNESIVENNLGSGLLFALQIAMSTAAAKGLMLSLTLFVVYWILAGPGGFALLKQYKQSKHAWIAFAGAAGVFTAIAWAGVKVTRENDVTITHLTFLDAIASPGASETIPHRANSWMSVYLPGYSPTSLFINSNDGERDLLLPWQPPGQLQQPFPNPDRYLVDVGNKPASQARFESRRDAAFEMPARSTAMELYANWYGVPLDHDDPWAAGINGEIEVVTDASGREIGLTGTLNHNLPGDLRDVKIFWIRNARNPDRRYALSDDAEQPWISTAQSGMMTNLGYMWGQSAWRNDQPLNLANALEISGQHILRTNIDDKYVNPFENRGIGIQGAPNALDQRTFLEMLSLFNQLTPPKYLKSIAEGPNENTLVATRTVGRMLDLSAWFTRPCVIIMGFVEDTPLPVPIVADGGTPESEGLTVYRWIYPLPVEPEIAFPEVYEAKAIDDDLGAGP